VPTIAVHDTSMVAGDASPVVPSAAWRKFNATFLHEAGAVALRLDVASVDQQDAWFLPLGGSEAVSLSGNAGLVELHPENPVTVQSGAGIGGFSSSTEVQVVFRLTSLWDDALAIDLDLRMVDGNGVYSMPATYRWTDGNAGLDDDLVLDGIDFSNGQGSIAPEVDYLIAGTPVRGSGVARRGPRGRRRRTGEQHAGLPDHGSLHLRIGDMGGARGVHLWLGYRSHFHHQPYVYD
jgi:hypothetical protein